MNHDRYILSKIFRDTRPIKKDEEGNLFIPMRRSAGRIYAETPTTLTAYWTENKRQPVTIRRVLAAVPSAEIIAQGDQELIIEAPLSEGKAFLEACKARQKRRLSEDHRTKLLSAAQNHWKERRSNGRKFAQIRHAENAPAPTVTQGE